MNEKSLDNKEESTFTEEKEMGNTENHERGIE
jgi:hypothetical protein